eukprot:7306319-Lingulodinium_polyedra.AAC.1
MSRPRAWGRPPRGPAPAPGTAPGAPQALLTRPMPSLAIEAARPRSPAGGLPPRVWRRTGLPERFGMRQASGPQK